MSDKGPLRVVVLGNSPALVEKLCDVPNIAVTVIDSLDSQVSAYRTHRGPAAASRGIFCSISPLVGDIRKLTSEPLVFGAAWAVGSRQ